MEIRRVEATQIDSLKPLLQELADYHNKIPSDFVGLYPLRPLRRTMEALSRRIEEGEAILEVLGENGRDAAFSGISFEGSLATIDYLFVRETQRGRGFGAFLMGRMLGFAKERGAIAVSLKVVAGNDAQGFYEKYGFAVRALVMSRRGAEA